MENNKVFLNIIRASLSELNHDVSHLSDNQLEEQIKLAEAEVKQTGVTVNERDEFLAVVFKHT